MLYSIGLLYLPISTYSLMSATQLAFNAIFSFFINSQKFTILILNSVVLLTLSSCLVAIHSDSDESKPKDITKRMHTIDFLCTLGASAGYSLLLSVMQFSFEIVLKRETFAVELDMQIYTSLVATFVCIMGLFGSGEWKDLRGEMERFGGGKVPYVMTLSGAALAWQVSSVGVVGLIFVVSSLFSNVISTLSLPLVPVFAVIFYHEKMDGMKVMAMLLAIWGFTSYLYQNYLDDYEPKATESDSNEDCGKLVMFKSTKMKSLQSDVFLKNMKLSNKDIIGSGGYGTVYRMTINDSTAFAVKRLNRGSADSDRGFGRELEAMGDTKHRNIVTLHGYYTAPHYNLLIYELMPNGSLDAVLHGGLHLRGVNLISPQQPLRRSMDKKVLDWASRYKIAVGAARGISYLHHDCIPHIIHRDIKASNILLDENMEARVSDFGLATLMEPDKTHVSTLVAGTFGYLAPEYFDTGRATAKGDVYSFGVVLLELMTGKKPNDEAFVEEGTKLVTWVKAVVQEKREELVLDSSLQGCPVDEINHVFSIAIMCLEPEPSKRPTMAEVLKMLEQMKFR
ncbi:hypothetical protein F0562_010511 [Nyssa sinensis]|uniref:Protein kinase domain-containing protein n=1 Tax=Nyssa sinensis TaxID=561372 RepID=A0A5J5A242_9ASTE|nr:hypothetical protein F0562_010511 [Nyssa sinensis]